MNFTMRPNVLVFLTDDHGQWASGCYGNTELHTPTMDWLAQTGARMTNAFTPCPVCSPARASFWTGRIPSAHGVHDHLNNPEHPGLDGQANLAMSLRDAGYRTALCGKWHCHAWGETPQPGFDFWFSQWRGTNARAGDQPFSENGEKRDLHGQQAPMITDAALRFLRGETGGAQASDEPFFLFVGYTDTHAPFTTLPERLVSKYRGATFRDIPDESPDDLPLHQRNDYFLKPPDEEVFRESLAQYYASVTLIDEQMGRILDELEGLGRLDNTLIIYTADHGHMNGHHGVMTKGNATVPQNFLEESIRIPLLARWPGKITEGTVRGEPADLCDLCVTLAEVANAEIPAGAVPSPGKSLRPLWAGNPAEEWRSWQFCEYGNAQMIRDAGGFKLVRRQPAAEAQYPDEFYDLNTDPRETGNRIDDLNFSEEIERLQTKLEEHLDEFTDPANRGADCSRQPRPNDKPIWEAQPLE